LFWVLATGAIVVLPDEYGRVRGSIMAVGLIVAVGLIFSLVRPMLDRPAPRRGEAS
jgi:hypothetical protein